MVQRDGDRSGLAADSYHTCVKLVEKRVGVVQTLGQRLVTPFSRRNPESWHLTMPGLYSRYIRAIGRHHGQS